MRSSESSFIPFRIGPHSFEQLFFLVDGIYPPWARFLKTIPVPMQPKQMSYAKWQEGSRKDIERAFGQLQGAFRILMNPVQAIKLSRVSNIVLTSVILHNMRVEEYVSGKNCRYKPDDGIDVEPMNDFPRSRNNVDDDSTVDEELDPNGWLDDYCVQWNKLTDHLEHRRLQEAIVEHVHTVRPYT